MGVVIIGIVAAVLLAVGAGAFLMSEERPAWKVYSTPSTRVGDPGDNLVGKKWTGEPTKSDVAAEESSS
jgi:hypothetical protein